MSGEPPGGSYPVGSAGSAPPTGSEGTLGGPPGPAPHAASAHDSDTYAVSRSVNRDRDVMAGLEIVPGRDVAGEDIPGIALDRRRDTERGVALGQAAARRAVLERVELEADGGAQRQLRDADEAEEHLEAAAGSDLEAHAAELRLHPVRIRGRLTVRERDERYHLEADVSARRDRDRQATLQDEGE